MTAMTPDPNIISTRVFAVPRETLFEAFENPAHLIHWWGPEGFTNTFDKFDFRPGGEWLFTMHGPNGTDYPNEKNFVEIVKPERIIFDHPGPTVVFGMEMTYEEEAGKTRLTWRMKFESPPMSPKFHDFITTANEQNFDRLEDYLKKMS